MSNATEPSQGESHRLAVFEVTGEQKTHLATITISKSDKGTWQVQMEGVFASTIARVRVSLDRFVSEQKSLETSHTEQSASPVGALAERLKKDGFVVEELPAADHSINIQIDLKRGIILGTHEATHGLVAKDDLLGRRIIESVAATMSKAFDDLAADISNYIANGKHAEAVLAIRHFAEKHVLGQPNDNFLQSLMAIDVTPLSSDDRKLLRNARMEVAQRLQRFDIMGSEAEALLTEYALALDPKERAHLKMAEALGAVQKGHNETALAIWRSLLKEPSDLGAEGRGWAWRNISMALSADDPEAKTVNKLSADAFLEAGNKEEAGKSLMGLVNILMKEDPATAIKTLNELIELLDKEGLVNRFVRAAALHARASHLAELHRHQDAYRDAVEAVELRRGLIRGEAEFVSSLHFAAIEARHIGAVDEAKAFEEEADKLTDEAELTHFQLSRRAVALSKAFDKDAAEELLRAAEAANDIDIVAAVRVFQANHDPTATDAGRLQILEETLGRVRNDKRGRAMMQPLQAAIGFQLFRMGNPERAANWFRQIMVDHPFDPHAREALIQCLWQTGQWGEAAKFLREQLDLAGNMPGLLFAYGKSLFEAGDLSGAISALTDSIKLADENADLRSAATELRERALQHGGTILPAREKKELMRRSRAKSSRQP